MRVIAEGIQRRCGYPPDKQAKATDLVLAEAEVVSNDWM